MASLEIWTFVHEEKRNHGRYLSDMWWGAYRIVLWQLVLRRAEGKEVPNKELGGDFSCLKKGFL